MILSRYMMHHVNPRKFLIREWKASSLCLYFYKRCKNGKLKSHIFSQRCSSITIFFLDLVSVFTTVTGLPCIKCGRHNSYKKSMMFDAYNDAKKCIAREGFRVKFLGRSHFFQKIHNVHVECVLCCYLKKIPQFSISWRFRYFNLKKKNIKHCHQF